MLRRGKRDAGPDTLETAKATLEAARADSEDERDRMKVLDSKLTNLAAFSGVSLSITSSLGASVIAADRVPLGFQIALGSLLLASAVLLLVGVVVCFRNLTPKLYLGIEVDDAKARLTPQQLKRSLELALAKFAATRVAELERARAVNKTKAEAATRAFSSVAVGFSGLILAIPVTVVGTVT